jgi:hypothetical protein
MSGYSAKAQPFLDAIAAGVFADVAVRNWLIAGTPMAHSYSDAAVLDDEQRAVRWASRPTKQPFWANYFCGRDSRCTCRIEGSKSLESDAIFFLRNQSGRVLAAHVEFKHPRECFEVGQPEGYALRAACFSRTHASRRTLNPHDDWATILFSDDHALRDPRARFFQRVITHREAAGRLPGYPCPPDH